MEINYTKHNAMCLHLITWTRSIILN